jgi:ferredoxin
MVKDENLCVHCGLCAERCPTAAWDMQKGKLAVSYAVDEGDRPWKDQRKSA